MKKFLTLCALCLMFFLVVPALIADISEVDLSDNLSFTFDSMSVTEKPLTLVPFVDLDFDSVQSNPIIEVEKNPPTLLIMGVSIMLGLFLHSALVS